MKDDTTNSHARATVTDLLRRALSAIGNKIFQADDRRARDRGWQVVPRHGGLSRSYRDPRFDRIVLCTACNGRGRDPREVACSHCYGAGRIVLDPAALSERGRGQP
jgi:hypothetical protein